MASKFPEEPNLTPFKFYVQKVGCSELEVRKVNLELNPEIDSTFKWLHQIVENLLVSWGTDYDVTERFLVQYVDDDGDRITIKTDSELKTFILEQMIPYKMFIQCLDNSATADVSRPNEGVVASLDNGRLQQQQQQQQQHVCTSCHQNVRGFRYACLVCHDFEICGRCEQRGIHPAHDMIRLSTSSTSKLSESFTKLQEFYGSLCRDEERETSTIEREPSKACQPHKSQQGSKKSNSSSEVVVLSSETVSSCSEVREESSESLERRLSNNTIDINLKITEMIDSTTTTTATTAIPDILKNDETKESLTGCSKSEIRNANEESLISQIQRKVESEIENIDAKSKSEEKFISKSDESIQSLREEIDQLLAPIISNQNEIVTLKQRRTPDSEQLLITIDDLDRQELKSRSKRSPSSIICDFIEEVVIENDGSNPEIEKRRDSVPNEAEVTVLKLKSVPRKSSKESQSDFDAIEVAETQQVELAEVGEEEPSKAEDGAIKIVDSEQDRQVTRSVEQIHRQTSDNVDTSGARSHRDIMIEPHYLTSSRIMLKNHLDRFNPNSDNKSDSGLRSTNRLSQDYGKSDFGLTDPTTSLPVHKSYTSLRSARANIDDVISSSSTSKHYSPTIDPVLYSRYPTTHYRTSTSRISDAVDQMLAMGFTDDDGWLTQLVTMKHGDIGQVLDILTPVEKTKAT